MSVNNLWLDQNQNQMIDFSLLTNQIFCNLVQDKDLAFDAILTCQNGQQPGKLLVDVADDLKT